jgi:hypothetical protein
MWWYTQLLWHIRTLAIAVYHIKLEALCEHKGHTRFLHGYAIFQVSVAISIDPVTPNCGALFGVLNSE